MRTKNGLRRSWFTSSASMRSDSQPKTEKKLIRQPGARFGRRSRRRDLSNTFTLRRTPKAIGRARDVKMCKPESFVHRLGNLIALPPGVNSKAGTKPFVDKLIVYKGVAGLHHVHEITK